MKGNKKKHDESKSIDGHACIKKLQHVPGSDVSWTVCFLQEQVKESKGRRGARMIQPKYSGENERKNVRESGDKWKRTR